MESILTNKYGFRCVSANQQHHILVNKYINNLIILLTSLTKSHTINLCVLIHVSVFWEF